MTDSQPWTIKRLLDWTQDFFGKHGSESPRLEAEILLAKALDCARIELYTRFDTVPVEPNLSTFRGWVKRRSEGEPVAYLVGHREFYSLKFKVNSDVLIPRPETEHLVLAAYDAAGKVQSPRILDIGTGSGCVAITLAKHLPQATVVATDCSAPALDVARENADDHEVAIEFLQSNLFENIPTDKFDFIVSNPPYIGTEEQGTVEEQVANHEPASALYAGPEGLDIIAPLILQSPDWLKPGGKLMFETSPIIMDKCLELVEKSNRFSTPEVVKDYSGHPRIVIAERAESSSD